MVQQNILPKMIFSNLTENNGATPHRFKKLTIKWPRRSALLASTVPKYLTNGPLYIGHVVAVLLWTNHLDSRISSNFIIIVLVCVVCINISHFFFLYFIKFRFMSGPTKNIVSVISTCIWKKGTHKTNMNIKYRCIFLFQETGWRGEGLFMEIHWNNGKYSLSACRAGEGGVSRNKFIILLDMSSIF